jgi:hypothetical protein
MSTTHGNKTAVAGTKLAPRKFAVKHRRTNFKDPDTDQTWREGAKCAVTEDPELWFSEAAWCMQAAQQVCRGCPVMEQCRSWATETRQSFGIWGAEDFGAAVKPWHKKRATS